MADAHFAMARVLDYGEWDWKGAEREYRRALTLNPADTQARTAYGSLLGRLLPGEHLVEHHPQRPDVRAVIDLLAASLFW